MIHRSDGGRSSGPSTSSVIALWSSKGGSGTTVVAAALAARLARRSAEHGSIGREVNDHVVLVDLIDDAPSVLGLPEPSDPGVVDWLATVDAVPVEALARLIRPAAAGLSLMARGRSEAPRLERVPILVDGLRAMDRPAVIDVGVIGASSNGPLIDTCRRSIVEECDRSLLVTRPCFLSLRRAVASGIRPDGVVLLDEPGRALGRTDVADVIGAPIVAVVPVEPAIARTVDAGLLGARPPAELLRALADVA